MATLLGAISVRSHGVSPNQTGYLIKFCFFYEMVITFIYIVTSTKLVIASNNYENNIKQTAVSIG